MTEAPSPPVRPDGSPAVYAIPPGVSFVDALAAGILGRCGGDPLRLADHTVLLPTRRAVRALREAFLRQLDGRPTLLPRMMPLGDVDEDDVVLSAGGDGTAGDDLNLPPAVGGLRRQFLLARLVMAADPGQRPDQAAHLAAELARLIDQVHTERLDFANLANLVPERFASHWQVTIDFLRIVTERWPAVLAEEGCLDPADRRNRLLAARAEGWRAAPPATPVVAAGSTGSIPATADLLAVVAALPDGAVVLPGIDRDLPEDAWTGLPPSHPQYGLGRLARRLGISPQSVPDWPGVAPAEDLARRGRLINRALWPAAATGAWRDTAAAREDLAELEAVDCATPDEEAGVIALVLRQAIEDQQRTAALVTPDRALARRVAAELRRWGIEIDDSAGTPLDQTPPGAFLRLTARMVAEDFAPVPLLAALKHPLACLGLDAGACRAQVRRLEIAALRGPRPGGGVAGLRAALLDDDGARLSPLLDALEVATAPFAAVLGRDTCDPGDLLRAHVAMAEALAADGGTDGRARLWAGEAGEAAAGFVAELAEAAAGFPAIAPAAYPALFDTLLAGGVVRPRFGRHARLHVWGLLEARLQQADVMVLGGLNEGTWPPEAAANPWMSRPMMAAFGLPQPERRIGLAAHDFTQAATAPRVVLTRSQRVDGTPTVPSRWLMRLETLLGPEAGRAVLAGQSPWRTWRGLLDRPAAYRPQAAPAPCPPVAARPRRLSVTQVEVWMRDPYGIYARHVLGLQALEPLDADPGAADYGSVIHDALDAFLAAHPEDLPADAEARLIDCGRKVFEPMIGRPGVWAFWWPRFLRIARWFVAQEGERRPGIAAILTETKGALDLDAPGGSFTITARADRIDRLADGTLAIIDYKTGQVPPAREVAAGFAPQLPLEAAIAAAGGFENAGERPVSSLEFWRLSGGDPAGTVHAAGDDPDGLGRDALEGLRRLVAAFDFPQTPYRARPNPEYVPAYSDYLHLARVKEWSSGPGDDT